MFMRIITDIVLILKLINVLFQVKNFRNFWFCLKLSQEFNHLNYLEILLNVKSFNLDWLEDKQDLSVGEFDVVNFIQISTCFSLTFILKFLLFSCNFRCFEVYLSFSGIWRVKWMKWLILIIRGRNKRRLRLESKSRRKKEYYRRFTPVMYVTAVKASTTRVTPVIKLTAVKYSITA